MDFLQLHKFQSHTAPLIAAQQKQHSIHQNQNLKSKTITEKKQLRDKKQVGCL